MFYEVWVKLNARPLNELMPTTSYTDMTVCYWLLKWVVILCGPHYSGCVTGGHSGWSPGPLSHRECHEPVCDNIEWSTMEELQRLDTPIKHQTHKWILFGTRNLVSYLSLFWFMTDMIYKKQCKKGFKIINEFGYSGWSVQIGPIFHSQKRIQNIIKLKLSCLSLLPFLHLPYNTYICSEKTPINALYKTS